MDNYPPGGGYTHPRIGGSYLQKFPQNRKAVFTLLEILEKQKGALFMFVLTETQIESLAQPIASMMKKIAAYYQEPEHESAFQEWYLQQYGHPAPDDV